MKKILLVASVLSHVAQFHRPLVDMLHQHGCEVHVAAHDNMDLKPGLKLDFVDQIIEVPFVRSVTDKQNVKAYKAIKEIIDDGNYEIDFIQTLKDYYLRFYDFEIDDEAAQAIIEADEMRTEKTTQKVE